MADKVNKEESIARVYQFLNKQKDWKTEADKNGNGTIVKTEFRSYLLGSGFKFNNGENKEDLIDTFWKSIDTNTTGKMGGGSKTNNKCALDSQEMQNIEKTLEVTNKINNFMQNKEAPSGIDSQYKTAWKNSVKQGLIYRASEFLKKSSIDEVTEEWLNNAYQLSAAKATADYTAAAAIKSELGNVDGYAVSDDKVLKGIIDEYISQLDENMKDETTIINEIKSIVSAYVDTAKTNSKSSTDLLANYGYDPDDYLNDLQNAVLVNDITEKILESVKSSNPEIAANENYLKQAEAAIKEYVEQYLEDKRASEFTSLQAFDASEFAKSDNYKTLVNDIQQQQTELKKAQDELYKYVTDILAEADEKETKEKAVSAAFGTSDLESIKKAIYDTKTRSEVNDLRAKVDAELKSELDKIAAEIEKKNAEYKAAFSGLASHIDDIQSDNIVTMVNGKSKIHAEFGMDEKGNIVFEQKDTTDIYEKMKSTLKEELKNKDKASYELIGEDKIDRLIQAAWITTYNTFKSSYQDNPAPAFVTTVLDNFKNILNKLKEKPEYLTVYTSNTAYSNTKLTSNLIYYGKKVDDGEDSRWEYSGEGTISSNGMVTWDDSNDAAEYNKEMVQLLKNIKKTEPYKSLDPDLVTSIFREAQQNAITACKNNVKDCPYGTTSSSDFAKIMHNDTNMTATPNTDWKGTSREDDNSVISIQALVELTLYHFDKLIYAKLAE